MRHLQNFEGFLKTTQTPKPTQEPVSITEAEEVESTTKEITITFDIDWNENIGKVEQKITLAMSPNSLGMYDLAPDVEENTGLPKKDAEVAKETPEDAFVYGMCNVMNGGKNLFFWTNGTRLSGEAKRVGLWAALFEQVSHECVHLTRLVLAKHILEKEGSKNWVGDTWPTIGDDPKVNKIDEEAFATALGLVVQAITDEFLKMASAYIPDLKV
jgi:hypothetical protein